ncbi:MAG: hypothetical protein LBQ51_04300 [Desulfovibrio sp.]|nr:hypothetical protein [Desulfovibrio sp.]
MAEDKRTAQGAALLYGYAGQAEVDGDEAGHGFAGGTDQVFAGGMREEKITCQDITVEKRRYAMPHISQAKMEPTVRSSRNYLTSAFSKRYPRTCSLLAPNLVSESALGIHALVYTRKAHNKAWDFLGIDFSKRRCTKGNTKKCLGMFISFHRRMEIDSLMKSEVPQSFLGGSLPKSVKISC